MSKVKELEEILKSDVLVEVKAEIEAIEKLLPKSKDKEDLQIELDYMLDVKKFYDEALSLIKEGKLSEAEAINILLDLEDMRDDGEDEV